MSDDSWKSEFDAKTRSELAVVLRVDQIEVGYRLREIDMAKVDALKASIEEMGLRTPISVSGLPGEAPLQMYRLSAGAHRLEAVRQIGSEYISAIVRDEDDLDAELWEIDENLCRAELTPADRALFVFRRKEIYELKHPETAHGGERTASRQVGELPADEPKRFSAATAEATGQSERAVQRDAERGEKISDKALRMLRGTRHDKGTVLDRLKSLREPEQEVYVKALFEADKAREAEANVIRTDKMATKRAIRTGIINAIASHGKVVVGEMPRAAFAVGYADPAWEQEAWSDETGQDRGLKYPPMPLDEIKALCAGDKSPFTPDAILFLWVTTNRLDDGIDVLKAWGFSFVSAITWDKQHIGMGRWVRDRTEHLLIGKRGDFPGLIMGTQTESLYSEAKSDHSRKPVWFAEQIERLFPDMRKLELFQRKASLAEGDIRLNGNWDFWGFEAGGSEVAEPTPPLDEPEPSAPKAAKSKGGGKKKSAYELAEEASAQRKREYRGTIPAGESDENLLLAAKSNLQGYDRAVNAGRAWEMEACADHISAIAEHLYGAAPDWAERGGPPKGNGRFDCLHDAQLWLMAQLAAPDGIVPMFGQPGRFLIELFGCRVDFRYSGLLGYGGGDAQIVDLNKPFFSETGYRGFHVTPHDDIIHAGGLDFKSYIERVCTEQFSQGEKKKVKLHPGPFGLGAKSGVEDQQPPDHFIQEHRKSDPAWQPGGYLFDLPAPDVQPASEPASRLPPGPGRNSPVEFHVGGMRKHRASFGVSLNDDGTYSISASFELVGFCGGESPRTGTISTFPAALRFGLAEISGKLREVASSSSGACSSQHKAAARAGVKWVVDRSEEWGLNIASNKSEAA